MSSHQAKLIRQYEGLRQTILGNIDTINQLVEQATQLSDLSESFWDDVSDDTKTSVKRSVDDINQTIFNLIKQTKELFVQYQNFAKEVFKN